MLLAVRCFACNQLYNVSDRFAGKCVRCKRCGAAINVPHPGYDLAAPEPLPSAESLRGRAAPVIKARTSLVNRRPPAQHRAKKLPLVVAAVATVSFFGVVLIIVVAWIITRGGGIIALVPRSNSTVWSPAGARDPGAPAIEPLTGTVYPIGDSAEEVLKKMLAEYAQLNNDLAVVIDATSATAQAPQVVARIKRLVSLGEQLDNLVIGEQEDQRLKSIYEPQLNAARSCFQSETARIKNNPPAAAAFGNRLQWEDVRQGLSFQLGRKRRKEQGPQRIMSQMTAALNEDSPSNPMAGMPEAQLAVVKVDGLPDNVFSSVYLQLRKFPGVTRSSGETTGTSATVTLAPVHDLHALAQSISFGKVTRIDDAHRMIYVKADASMVPAPIAPEVTDPASPDFYRQNLADLTSLDEFRRHHAAKRLASAPRPKEVQAQISRALINLVSDETVWVSIAAIKALPAWAEADAAMPSLLKALGDNDLSRRDAAMRALGEYRDVRAVKPILAVGNRAHPSTMETALIEIGTAAEPILLEHLEGADKRTLAVIIKVLGEIGTRQSLPVLQRFSRSDDVFMRVDAEQSLDKLRQRLSQACARADEVRRLLDAPIDEGPAA